MSKRLLQLNVTANWGSTGKIAEGIGLSAMKRGWESYISYGRYMNSSKSNLIKVGSKIDVYGHYARSRFLDREGLGSKKPTRRLIEQIDIIKPDIIHLHNIHDHWLNYPLLFDYFASINIPIIWTFHDCWAFTGGCTHFEDVGCFAWRNEKCSMRCPLLHKEAKLNYEQRTNSFSSVANRLHVVAVSEWLSKYISESLFQSIGATINIINNGIDVNGAFKPSKEKIKMILGVSNVWTEDKGLNDFKRIRNLLPDDVVIQLVGLSQSQIKSLPKGIKGISRTSNIEQLADMYSEASVLVNPTYNDSFPTVNLEALACGTPVVTYRTGGSPEAVDANTGIVVEKGDVKGLTNAILKIINNPNCYTIDSCRSRAVEYFNKDIQFNKYIDLYEQILS